jgi:hypothetical protein
MSKEHRSFRNYLIYPSFQWRLVMMMMGLSLISALSLVIFQYYAFEALNEIALEYSLPDSHPFFMFLKQFQESFYVVLFSSLTVSVVFSFILGFLISHKVAGPLVKMRHRFNEIADKTEPDGKIFFRQGDFFQDVADAYNRRFDA